MIRDFNSLAKEIIETNQYMTLATNGWASPVCYAFDKNYNLYWVSMPDSRHSQNIAQNPHVSVAIFDSHQNWGEGVGLQIEGTAYKLSLSDYLLGLKIYFGRKWPYGKSQTQFKKQLDNETSYFYKFSPAKFWLNDPKEKVDIRVAINPN